MNFKFNGFYFRYAGGLGKRYGGAVGRIDVFKNSQSSPSLSTAALPPPLPLIPPLPPIAIPGLLTPDPGNSF